MASLTELCSICFINTPKYTCPRCSCQTCSVSCVKIHKKRAACSGVRNPAAYFKSSELATPASIDRDYNFITKVQRDIEKAEDGVVDRGMTLAPARIGKNTHAGKSKLQLEYEACGVTVVKAPIGLTRSKQNKTHWDKRHGCVMWTVEWVLQNDQRVLANVQGGRPVTEAFTNGVGKRGLQRKRKLGEDERENDVRSPKSVSMQKDPISQQPAADESAEEQLHEDIEAPVENRKSEAHSSPQATSRTSAVDNIAPQMHFYLHRPRTSSKLTCLIPILPSMSISDVLRDRTILEYPTIYARPEAEDELVSPFISEKDYEDKHGIDVALKIPVLGQEDETAPRGGLPDHIDEKKIMEVLKRDIVS